MAAADPYRYFRVEARELLEQLGQDVLALEQGVPGAEPVARLFRLAHTLKGAARVVKQAGIAEAAHAIEDLLEPLRAAGAAGAAAPGRAAIDALLAQLDAAQALLATLALAPAPGPAALPAPTESAAPADAQPLRLRNEDVAEMDSLLEGMTEASVQLGALRTVVARAGLHAEAADLERALTGGLDRLERELGQVRETAERLRLVSVSAVFATLERVARDTAHAVGRRVDFVSAGSDIRLDAHVLGVVQDALVQLTRNAIAHGIEPEGVRLAAGKPAVGRVQVTVARRGTRVVLTCVDDGRGVDLEAVRRLALARGLLPPGGARPGDDELVALLLAGGLSTARAITEVSGRGVGLDVVREAATRLGGEVRVSTQPGRETRVELIVPVSMSSIDTLVVGAAGVTAAIPLDAVRGTLRLRVADITRTAAGESIVHAGQMIPFVSLEAPLSAGAGARARRPAPRAAASAAMVTAVIIEAAAGRAAVGVDRLIGTQTVVLRALPALAPADPVVAGASLDAQGHPQLVLDPEGLVAAAARPAIGFAREARPAKRSPILVVDDSLTTRMLEQSILESAGYDVELATSAEEALDKASQRTYGLFLVDVEMPGMDGFAFVERTRADPALRDVPAILMTSRGSPADRRRGVAAGARAYIVKGEFDQNELLAAIGRLLR